MTDPQAADRSTTTIKVPQSLRRRIARDAAETGVTAAAFLTTLVDRFERDRRFAEVRRAYSAERGERDPDYADLVSAWDRASADDLGDLDEVARPDERDARREGRG